MKTRFHEHLSRFRRQRGLTQAQMAEMLEIPLSIYKNYETGECPPDFDTLEKISDVLECSLDELFGRNTSIKNMEQIFPDMICESPAPYQAAKAPSGKRIRSRRQGRLEIGVQDFRLLREKGAYYVDKTWMIEEFLDSWYQVTLITRPRRFGKTLNMSMLAEFLDCTKKSEDLFADTYISRSELMSEMNQYPVVFLSFLNVKPSTPEEMTDQLAKALEAEYRRYYKRIQDGTLSEKQTEAFNYNYECLSQPGCSMEKRSCITRAAAELCRTLEEYFGKKVFLFLDEYDTPFLTANSRGYYGEVRDILAGLLGSLLKGNPSLGKALLTGIQRTAKENIFSGLNNLIVCTVADSEYQDCFGFTEEEVQRLLEHCGVPFTEDVKEMYDGYLFGDTEVYNPWSVSCYAARKTLEPYWVNTSENSILKEALGERGASFADMYKQLIEKGTLEVRAELSTAYYEKPNDASLWGLLLNAGMVTVQEKTGEGKYRLRVPNREVWKVFQELTAFYLQVEESDINMMMDDLRTENLEKFSERYQRILLELPSYYDLKSENSYHMMMLGMCAFLGNSHEVKSNEESGQGRSDILLYARKPEFPSMVLEFKYTKKESQSLEALALDAVRQIREKNYDAQMQGKVYHIGLAHYGKQAQIRYETYQKPPA